MKITHILHRIPKKLQKTYNIGKTVGIVVVEVVKCGVNGGQFIFLDKDGKKKTVDAVKFFGTNITMKLFEILEI